MFEIQQTAKLIFFYNTNLDTFWTRFGHVLVFTKKRCAELHTLNYDFIFIKKFHQLPHPQHLPQYIFFSCPVLLTV